MISHGALSYIGQPAFLYLSYLQKEAISIMFSLGKSCANHNKPIVRFVGHNEGNFYDSLDKRADISQKSRKS